MEKEAHKRTGHIRMQASSNTYPQGENPSGHTYRHNKVGPPSIVNCTNPTESN